MKRPSLYGSAAVVAAMTLLSRLTGLAQTFFLAHFLGAGPAADAFAVAFRLPNLLRRFTAEGTMTAAFLPTLAEAEADPQADIHAVARNFLGSLLWLLLAGVALFLLAMGPLAALLTWWRPAAQTALTATLGRIMFPYLALVSLAAGFAALLNFRHRFGLPAAISVFWNLTFIAFAWASILVARRHGAPSFERVAVLCALAVLAGGAVQLGVLVPAARREGFGIAFAPHLRDPWVRKALRRMGPGLLAAGIYPINAFVSTYLASSLPDGAQVVLFNSGMMGEMVLGLFAMSLATASLPQLATLAAAKDWEGMDRGLRQALSTSALLVLPASAGLAVLARPICALLFRTGAYAPTAADWTAATLVFQCLGLVFVAFQRLGTQALYALRDYRGPAAIAVATLLANVVLSVLLLHPLGTAGLALSNGLASLLGSALLGLRLRPRLPAFRPPRLAPPLAKAIVATMVLGLLAWAGPHLAGFPDPHALGRSGLAARLLPWIALCAAAYFGTVLALRHPEARDLFQALRRKLS